ncbi:glycerophosphoryl diester phosphodiesterase [Scopulibacillus darangshiensis]|uniref:Glycerophosphoryl diester phosphodiesterase n=1 Tax=Scopulibacillus darangshiensis TaxID=442528 RepID=A0A4R2NKG3_9BACL|nr:glycerophosphodiester phosphodiesterase family protein [Scopulibacillus darangshiensis]TCP21872.1 glycerophosphoryl diester phosphodiesterase [Scopulibacillus darangshiensis]
MTIHFAHMGSSKERPENTLPSFQRALEHGAKAMELDVQLTKDGHLVICHDQKINRVAAAAGAAGFIKDFTLEEIEQIDVGSTFSEEYKGVTLTTLDAVLGICPPDVLLNIEIKNIPFFYEGIEEKVLDRLAAYNHTENVIISSFDHHSLKRIKALAPDTRVGLLFLDQLIEPWHYAKNCGIDVYSLHPRYVFIDENYVKKCHEAGFKVYPFTVDDIDMVEQFMAYGVDGVFSNNPEIFGLECCT